MARAILFAALLLLAAPAWAEQTVTLLTSLPPKKALQIDVEKRLEAAFREHFVKGGYRLKVVHRADQKALWDTLHDPSNVALFWLSHAGYSENPGAPGTAAVVDSSGFDLLDVFSQVHPNTRFLGVIGCKTEQIFGLELAARLSSSNPGLRLRLFDKNVNAGRALKKAMESADPWLDRQEVREGYDGGCPARTGYRAVFRRESGTGSVAVRLEGGNSVLAVWGAEEAGEREIHLPVNPASASALKLLLNAGSYFGGKVSLVSLGRLMDQDAWSGAQWAVFADGGGEPIGVWQNVYRYRGTFPVSAAPETYLPFECRAMPSR